MHGAIDGFSRVITYIFCADYNRAPTVFNGFQNGVDSFGLPEKVRSDKWGGGGETWMYGNTCSKLIITMLGV